MPKKPADKTADTQIAKTELVDRIAEETGVPYEQVGNVLKLGLQVIIDELQGRHDTPPAPAVKRSVLTPGSVSHPQAIPAWDSLPPKGGKNPNLGTRIRPELKTALDQPVYGLKGQGWPIDHHHVVELLLEPLLTPEGQQQILTDLPHYLERHALA